jgi:hypothetical protein
MLLILLPWLLPATAEFTPPSCCPCCWLQFCTFPATPSSPPPGLQPGQTYHYQVATLSNVTGHYVLVKSQEFSFQVGGGQHNKHLLQSTAQAYAPL